MVSVVIDRKTRRIISIVQGQKLRKTEEYLVYHTDTDSESEILKELNFTDLLYDSEVIYDIVFRRDALGDVLMLLPVIAGLKREYPYLKLALQTDDWIIPLLKDLPFLDFVSHYHSSLLGLKIDLRKVGDFIVGGDGQEEQHRTLYYLEQVEKDIKHFNYKFELNYNYELEFTEDKNILSRLDPAKNWIVLAPLSKSYFRMWGYKDRTTGVLHYTEIDLIKAKPEFNFVVLHNKKINAFDGFDNVLNLTGKTDIVECATICKNVNFGIVPDSGIMHLLGKFNIPTIAVFGNTANPDFRISKYRNTFAITTPTKEFDQELYNADPYCHLDCCWAGQVDNCQDTNHDKWCTRQITVDKVLKKYVDIKSEINSLGYCWDNIITFVFVGDTNLEETLKVVELYKKYGIPNIKVFTSKDIGIDEWVKIPPLYSLDEYNRFILQELYKLSYVFE